MFPESIWLLIAKKEKIWKFKQWFHKKCWPRIYTLIIAQGYRSRELRVTGYHGSSVLVYYCNFRTAFTFGLAFKEESNSSRRFESGSRYILLFFCCCFFHLKYIFWLLHYKNNFTYMVFTRSEQWFWLILYSRILRPIQGDWTTCLKKKGDGMEI